MALSSSLDAEAAKTEQITVDFLNKSLHVILDSRIPSFAHSAGYCHFGSPSSSPSSCSGRVGENKSSNLASERLSLSEGLKLWRQNMSGPIVVDIVCVQADRNLAFLSKKQNMLAREQVIERWTLQNQIKKPRWRDIPPGKCTSLQKVPSSSNAESSLSYKKTYKKTVILLRSLYCTARLLPAYRLFQRAKSSSNCNLSLAYKVYFGNETVVAENETGWRFYRFAPLETSCGTICASILYRPNTQNLANAFSQAADALPPQIITDYVRSPSSSDTLPRMSSDSTVIWRNQKASTDSLPHSTSSATGCTAFVRRHSWNGVLHKVLHSPQSPLSPNRLSSSPSFSPSQSHGYSPSPDIPHYPVGSRPQRGVPADHSFSPNSSPRHRLSSNACQSPTFRKTVSLGNRHRLSPPFSPSPPSSSSRPKESSLYDYFSHPGSAPVSIPSSVCRNSRNRAVEQCSPNKACLPPLSPNTRPELLRRSATECHFSRTFSLSKPEQCQISGNVYSGPKLCKDNKDDSGHSQRMKFSPSGTLLSRSSSRKSYQDETEDEDFACPFALYEDEVTDWTNRTYSSEEKQTDVGPLEILGQMSTPRKSQSAAVGALVQLLDSAMPLQRGSEDVYDSIQNSSHPKSITKEDQRQLVHSCSSFPTMQVSGGFVNKTTADALEELRGYREIKEILLSQSGSRVVHERH
eukprot:TRINITY_DN10187_c0_g1_i1.p1 TRINITY_DN10187_c0_g1~~TRINITY_DN10187_c0_g1_i1.p1  ORF type:complete len:690 (+),score=77.55 TRINITY_DN10187_c0_g1_i1:814-2883(+)